MKPKFLLKGAAVAMAAFGAFAFNGNTQTNTAFNYQDGNVCKDVQVECSDDGRYMCQVRLQSNSSVHDVWGLSCTKAVNHTTPTILDEI